MTTSDPSSRSSEQSGGAERRRWPRATLDLPITVSLDEGKSEARVRDLSRSGVCFFLDRPIPAMTVLEVQLALPVPDGTRHVRGHGAVVRCEKISARIDHYEIAVFMHDMAEPDRELLEEYVASPPTIPPASFETSN